MLGLHFAPRRHAEYCDAYSHHADNVHHVLLRCWTAFLMLLLDVSPFSVVCFRRSTTASSHIAIIFLRRFLPLAWPSPSLTLLRTMTPLRAYWSSRYQPTPDDLQRYNIASDNLYRGNTTSDDLYWHKLASYILRRYDRGCPLHTVRHDIRTEWDKPTRHAIPLHTYWEITTSGDLYTKTAWRLSAGEPIYSYLSQHILRSELHWPR